MAHAPFDKAWDNAKTEFQKITGKHKPKEPKNITNAFGKHTGLSGSLKKCEESYQACEKTDNVKEAKKGQKLALEFAGHLKEYTAAKDQYMNTLDATIHKEVDAREKGPKEDYERALKYLRKELVSLEANIKAAVVSYTQKFDAAAKNLSITEKMIANYETNMKGCLARAMAGVAKVKATRSAAAYNALFPTTARDISMQLVFAEKMDGLRFVVDPGQLKASLAPWIGNHSIPTNSSPEQVDVAIRQFNEVLKNVTTHCLPIR
jgi:hypothetical protein